MPKEFLQNYNAESHAIYLGKNRRLADPVFFPAPGPAAHMVETAQATLALEMEAEPDGPRNMTRGFMNEWGWGNCIRYPPGGPAPRLKDYEKAMNTMASDVHQTWNKIQILVRNHEHAIQRWILDSYPRIDDEASRANNRLFGFILRSWYPTVADFNDCHSDIKMFMKPKSIESDFDICVPDFKSPRKFPFSFLNQYFLKGHAVTGTPSDRGHYLAACRHPSNFFDPRYVEDWPHKGEPNVLRNKDPLFMCNHPNSREFYKRHRISFLVPHIASYELIQPVRLLSFIHSRGRLHPSVFAKIDNDMTFIGRRTNYLSGPFVSNRMVSLGVSSSDSVKNYYPKLWMGWAGRPDPEFPETVEEYDDLWHRGQLYGSSEAWIILQSQRVTYHYLWHLLTAICYEMKLDPIAGLTPKTLQEQDQVFNNAKTQVDALQKKNLSNWMAFTRQQPFLPPPTQISPRFSRELQSKMEVAELHIQDLFGDPGYFFDSIQELKEHHWGNIGMKNDERNPDTYDHYSIYIEQYTNEKTRHILYFDLIRGMLRRSIFEFYMWRSIHTRLQEFESMMRETFKDYGKDYASDTDGTNMLQQPPLLLSDRKKREHARLAEKYLSLVVLLRYHAAFFVNEFRKKGVHAGSTTMSSLTYSIGLPQEEIQDRICNIQKKHYGAPDLKYRSKIKDSWFPIEGLSETDRIKICSFEAIDSFIVNSLDCTNCGIKDAAGYLQEMTQTPKPEQREAIFTGLLDDTIDGLDLLSSLADHLEYLWPAMDRVGGAAVDESLRRKYFDMGSKDVTINFLEFDAFTFDEKVPMKRLKRLFLFFDELQRSKPESVSVGHAKGDLQRFGALLPCKLIYPLNDKVGAHKANKEAMLRLEKAMGVSAFEYTFGEKESPFNLDQEEAGRGAKVTLISQPRSYRNTAARERDLAKKRQERRDALIEELVAPSKADQAREKRRLKKLARRHDKARRRARASGEPVSGNEDEDEDGGEDKALPDVQEDNAPAENDPRWEESLHSTLKQLQLPPIPETRTLAEPPVAAPPFSASFQPAPKAPDGRPKGLIKKREWTTLEAIYGIHSGANSGVSYAQLRATMGALGYDEVGRGGSHMSYIRQQGRWPHDALPRGENIQLARTHGRERAAAAKGKSRNWGRRLCGRGLTFDFIKQWYVRG